MNMDTAVILAAGRGSRMKGLTEACPKCLLELAGHPLLYWQQAALRDAGLQRLIVVRGYHADMLCGDFETVDNPRWAETNMVRTLLCAFPLLQQAGDVIVSYADIVYHSAHVRALGVLRGDICLTYDTRWEELWRLRQENVLEDAETFRQEGGRLLEIGGRPQHLDEVQGQYMGLLKFSPEGRRRVAAYVESLSPSQGDKLDMTSLLRALLAQGEDIRVCPVAGGWCECDTPEDIQHYEQRLREGAWPHDWRTEKKRV